MPNIIKTVYFLLGITLVVNGITYCRPGRKEPHLSKGFSLKQLIDWCRFVLLLFLFSANCRKYLDCLNGTNTTEEICEGEQKFDYMDLECKTNGSRCFPGELANLTCEDAPESQVVPDTCKMVDKYLL